MNRSVTDNRGARVPADEKFRLLMQSVLGRTVHEENGPVSSAESLAAAVNAEQNANIAWFCDNVSVVQMFMLLHFAAELDVPTDSLACLTYTQWRDVIQHGDLIGIETLGKCASFLMFRLPDAQPPNVAFVAEQVWHEIASGRAENSERLRKLKQSPALLRCVTSDTTNAKMLCSGCGATKYCDVACQRRHWSAGHRNECREDAQRLLTPVGGVPAFLRYVRVAHLPR